MKAKRFVVKSITGWRWLYNEPSSGGAILRTTDGGTTWTPQTSGTASLLLGVSFTDSDNGTAVGVTGIILRTTNGGVVGE